MRPLRVAVSDYSRGFDPETCPWMLALRERFDVRRVALDAGADVLFYSDFGREHWGFRGLKAYFTGENMLVDPMQHDFALTSNIRPDDPRHFRLAQFRYAVGDPERLVRPADFDAEAELRAKSGFCSFVVSNPRGSERNRIFRMLDSRRGVASGGRHFNNVGGPVPDKIAFARRFRFSLCFENSSAPGYTTEKLTDAFLACTVPIYWGNPEVARDFNPRAMILAHDFPSLDALAEHVLAVEDDPHRFLGILREPPLAGNLVGPGMRLDGLADALESFLTSGAQPAPRAYRARRLREHCHPSPLAQTMHALRWRTASKLWNLRRALLGVGAPRPPR